MAIPLLPVLSALPGVIEFGANLFDRRRRKNQEDKAMKGISNLSDVFKTSLEGNYMDTPEVTRILAEIQKNQNANTRATNAAGASTGMTDEAKIAYAGQNNKASADAIGGIAGGADIWRRGVQKQYGDSLATLFDAGQANRANFNESISNITQPLKDSIDGAANSGAFDGITIFNKRKKKPRSIYDNNNLTGNIA